MRLAKRRITKDVVELNITAFLNLMVILVPFLLITAVFSRVTILELNLPPKDARVVQPEKIKLQLELVIRPQSFEIQDSNLGRIKYLQRDAAGTDWAAFTEVLVEIKSRFPDEQNISLLLDKQVAYKTLIEVMDRVRSADVVNITEVENVELFPNISIGDAPELEADAAQAETVDGEQTEQAAESQ